MSGPSTSPTRPAASTATFVNCASSRPSRRASPSDSPSDRSSVLKRHMKSKPAPTSGNCDTAAASRGPTPSMRSRTAIASTFAAKSNSSLPRSVKPTRPSEPAAEVERSIPKPAETTVLSAVPSPSMSRSARSPEKPRKPSSPETSEPSPRSTGVTSIWNFRSSSASSPSPSRSTPSLSSSWK